MTPGWAARKGTGEVERPTAADHADRARCGPRSDVTVVHHQRGDETRSWGPPSIGPGGCGTITRHRPTLGGPAERIRSWPASTSDSTGSTSQENV